MPRRKNFQAYGNARQNKGKEVVIFEPHIDDALLSCATRLLATGYEAIHVVSFHTGDERNSLNYRTRLNRKIIPVILPISEIHFRHSRRFALENLLAGQSYQRITYPTLHRQFAGYRSVLRGICCEASEHYLPYGVFHAHHIVVNHLLTAFFQEEFPQVNYYFYLDQPYSFLHPDYLERAHVRNRVRDFAARLIEEDLGGSDMTSLMRKCFPPFFLTSAEDRITRSLYLRRA